MGKILVAVTKRVPLPHVIGVGKTAITFNPTAEVEEEYFEKVLKAGHPGVYEVVKPGEKPPTADGYALKGGVTEGKIDLVYKSMSTQQKLELLKCATAIQNGQEVTIGELPDKKDEKKK